MMESSVEQKDPAESPESKADGASTADGESVPDDADQDNRIESREEAMESITDLIKRKSHSWLLGLMDELKRQELAKIDKVIDGTCHVDDGEDRDNDDAQQDTRGFGEHLRDALTEEIDEAHDQAFGRVAKKMLNETTANLTSMADSLDDDR